LPAGGTRRSARVPPGVRRKKRARSGTLHLPTIRGSARRFTQVTRTAVNGTKSAPRRGMNQFVGNFVGWLALLLIIAVATLFWGIAALLVWISGNGSATSGPRLAK